MARVQVLAAPRLRPVTSSLQSRASVNSSVAGRRMALIARVLRQPEFRSALRVIRNTPDIFQTVQTMMGERDQLTSGRTDAHFTALLTGIAANSRGRALLDLAIGQTIRADQNSILRALGYNGYYVPEIVIGAGTHAAIYAAAKVSAGGDPPLLIDSRKSVGGVFGAVQRPVFYLNSRNRREDENLPRLPGTEGPLNSEIAGVLQPSDLSPDEYQTQADLGFVTRLNIALFARVLLSQTVRRIDISPDGRYAVTIDDLATRRNLFCDRIIVASGLGKATGRSLIKTRPFITGFADRRILSFEDFLARVGSTNIPFPLKGMKRVAVIGANDSGRVVVEHLLGQGPRRDMSIAGVSEIDTIYWIGQKARTKEEFEARERSRYKGIGRAMPRQGKPDYYFRVQPINARVTAVAQENDEVRVDLRYTEASASFLYDHVIVCTGYEESTDELFQPLVNPQVPLTEDVFDGEQVVAKRYTTTNIYRIGPAAGIPVTAKERDRVPVLRDIPDNSVSLFRYAERTAALARKLVREGSDAEPLLIPRTSQQLSTLQAGLSCEWSTYKILGTNTYPHYPDATDLDVIKVVIARIFEDFEVEQDLYLRVKLLEVRRRLNFTLSSVDRSQLVVQYSRLLARLAKDRPLIGALLRQTDRKINRDRAVRIVIPFHKGKLDIERITCGRDRTSE